MHRGYVKLWRSTKDSWLRADPVASHLFFTFFLLEAAWKETEISVNGQLVTIHPGEVVFGRSRAANVCGLSEKSVRNAVERLAQRASIRASKRASNYTIYSVVNWDTYQSNEDNEGQQEGQQFRQKRASKGASKGATIEEGKKFNTWHPSLENVRAYCRERGNNVDPEKWFDHYTANGWMVGKNPMRNWQAAVRTWEKNDKFKPAQSKTATACDQAFPFAEFPDMYPDGTSC